MDDAALMLQNEARYKQWQEEVFDLDWNVLDEGTDGGAQKKAANDLKNKLKDDDKDNQGTKLEEQAENQKNLKDLYNKYTKWQKYDF